MAPGRSDIERLDLRTLVARTERSSVQRVQHRHAAQLVKLLIVRVRVLEPGAGVVKVQVKSVIRRELVVEAVEEILFVPWS